MPSIIAQDGTRIVYDTFGNPNGEPLLLLMGLAVDRWGWIRQRAEFAPRYRCIAIDNRGSGLSDAPEGPYDLMTMSADAMAVLDAEGIESAHVVGYSLGGVLAQVTTVLYPERVRSVVVASSACRVKDWRRTLLAEWIELIETRGVGAFARENIRWVAAARYQRWITPMVPAMAPLIVRAPAHGVIGQIHAMLSITEQIHDALGSITVPSLVIVGSQDILTPVADSEEIASKIPTASLSVVRGAAHGLVVTSSGVFNSTVSGFLSEITTAAAA